MQKKGRFFQLVIHEKYRSIIKWIRYSITLIGLFSAFIVFQSVIYAFIFGVIIHLFGVIINEVIFTYNSLYIHYLPDFELEPEKWTGCFLGYVSPPNGTFQIPFIGWTHNDEEYARKVHSLISRWVEDDAKDEKHNICMSIVILNDDEYIFYCYPNYEKEKADKFHEKVERKRKEVSLTDQHIREFFLLLLGKRCDYSPNSFLPSFAKKYKNGTPFFFRIALDPPKYGDQPIEIDGLNDFYFNRLKIKKAEDLTRNDIEYDSIKFGEI